MKSQTPQDNRLLRAAMPHDDTPRDTVPHDALLLDDADACARIAAAWREDFAALVDMMDADAGYILHLQGGEARPIVAIVRRAAPVSAPVSARVPGLRLALARPDGTAFGSIVLHGRDPGTATAAQRRMADHFRRCIEELLARMDAETERARTDAALGRERERFLLASAASGAGIWDYNIDADILYCDARWHRILGLDPVRPVTSIADFKPHIHPDDAARATDVQTTLAELAAGKEDYAISFRIIRPSGEIRWLRSVACIVAAGPGTPNRAVGAVFDITELQTAAAALEASETRFKTMADSVPQIVFSAAADGTNDYVNGRFHEFIGRPADAAAGTPSEAEDWQGIVHPDDRAQVAAAWRRSVATGARFDVTCRCRRHPGQYRWMHAAALPIRDGGGAAVRWFGSLTDIHETQLLATERDLVARELEHRIRNIFALINALIGLSMRDEAEHDEAGHDDAGRDAPGPAGFADRLRRRLDALHNAHDLIRSGARAADSLSLVRLVRALLAPYESRARGRIMLMGEDIAVGRDCVTNLALIFHELATNSAKYGALRPSGGRLDIAFERRGPVLRAVWTEHMAAQGTGNGPAAADDAAREHAPSVGCEGFGSKLLTTLVHRQFEGHISRRLTDTGLEIELVFPLDALGAAAPPNLAES